MGWTIGLAVLAVFIGIVIGIALVIVVERSVGPMR